MASVAAAQAVTMHWQGPVMFSVMATWAGPKLARPLATVRGGDAAGTALVEADAGFLDALRTALAGADADARALWIEGFLGQSCVLERLDRGVDGELGEAVHLLRLFGIDAE